MKRRDLLKGGAAVTVAVAGGGAWRAYDRGAVTGARGAAYEPWDSWRSADADPPFALVRAAILASNPHNTQPWLFRAGEGAVEVYADTRRHLGTFDPYRREMYLGLGCAVENMLITARALGFDPQLSVEEGRLDPPPPDDRRVHVATIRLQSAAAVREARYDAIASRHTNRGPYEDAPLPAASIARLKHVAGQDPVASLVLIEDGAARASFGELIVGTTESIIADATMVHDSERWYRHTRREVERHRDGPTLDATGLPPLRVAVAKLLPRPSAEQNHDYWLDNTREIQVATAAVFGMVLVRDLYDVATTLHAGRLWQRLHLEATTLGLAMQPLNQPVELVDRERSLGRESATSAALSAFTEGAGEPTFVFRAGVPVRAAGPSPRRRARDVLI